MSRFISETIQDTGRVIMKGDYEIVSKLLNGVSFNDLEWPLTQISRSRYHSTSNNSKMVQDRYTYSYNGWPIEKNGAVRYDFLLVWPIESHIEQRHFQWPWTIPNTELNLLCQWIQNPDFKIAPLFNVEYLRRYPSYNKILKTHVFLKSIISTDLEWPGVTWRNVQWHEASRGLSATAELRHCTIRGLGDWTLSLWHAPPGCDVGCSE